MEIQNKFNYFLNSLKNNLMPVFHSGKIALLGIKEDLKTLSLEQRVRELYESDIKSAEEFKEKLGKILKAGKDEETIRKKKVTNLLNSLSPEELEILKEKLK